MGVAVLNENEVSELEPWQTPPDHDACGTVFFANENGTASNEILKYTLDGVAAMEHRGGPDDGVGITVQVDQDYWKGKFAKRFGEGKILNDDYTYTELGKKDVAVGLVFLPRDDRKKFNRCREIFEEEFNKEGYEVSDRDAPMGDKSLSIIAKKTRPRIYQYCVLQKDGITNEKFDADVYRIRRRIEKRVKAEGLSGQGQNRFYIPSFSRHIITFKGLAQAHKLKDLYKDLKYDEDLVERGKNGEIINDDNYKTAFAIAHRRYATNTSPTWERAHPYHAGVAHNGEINSLATNVEMFKQRLEKVFLNLYGPEYAEDLKDVIDPDGTDSAQLADAVDFLKHAGLSAATIMALLVPEAVMPGSEISDNVRSFYEFADVMLGPWDGPSTLIMADNNEVLIGGDRSGFRPINIVRTKDGIVYGASEDGILQHIPNKDIIERRNLEPGQKFAVNFKEGRIIRDTELKERAAKELEEKFGFKKLLQNVQHMVELPAGVSDYKLSDQASEKELALRQRLGGFSRETIDYIDTMAGTGKEPLGSMGDDAALTVSSSVYRTVQNFLQQKFAQVTNPPLDTIREKVVTSLKTHLGFFFDRNGKKNGSTVIKLDSAILNNATFKAMREKINEADIVEIKCRFDAHGHEDQLQFALDRICAEAEVAARFGKHVVLTDEYTDLRHAAIPMVLATGAVNTHLAKLGLRGQTSLNVRSAEAHEAHDFAALIGLGGADTVNAYMAEETIAARYDLGIYTFEDETSAYRNGTTLNEMLALYADTGDEKIDARRKTILDNVQRAKQVQDFVAAYGSLSLENLAKNSDEAVRTQFLAMMKGIEVSVHDVFGNQSLEHAVGNWKKAAQNGLLKIMGKMGISHIASYRGGRLFEALGLSKEVIARCFPGVASPINGLSLAQLQERQVAHHKKVHETDPDAPLEHKGRYKFRNGTGAEPHVMTAELIEMFQDSVKQEDFAEGYKLYRAYVDTLKARKEKYRFGISDWIDFKSGTAPVNINEVESRDDIVRRFFTGAMSRGSLSQEAHETIAIAANRRGFTSCSGEGGEDPERYGTEKRSKSKQSATARFGKTLDYQLDADEMQIKMAQGAKPGEGGELPGKKVTKEIAKLRHCEEGTDQISPSTHHDMYSIEDFEQLTFDIKEVNDHVRVSAKLVSTSGVDVIASGCAKANADTALISGYNGGTGASAQGSIAHAGMPREANLNKVYRTLKAHGFGDRMTIGTDGGLHIGRDIVIAALMGAEEYGFGLQALIAEGCKLVRTCQNGKCPFKIAGDEGEFIGTPEMIINMMDFIAEDVREILAELGFKSLDEAIGRTDKLEQVWGMHLGLNLADVIPSPAPDRVQKPYVLKKSQRNERVNPKDPGGLTIDQKTLRDHQEEMMAAIRSGQSFQTDVMSITNEDRTFGARISGVIRQAVIDAPDLGRATKAKEDTIVLNLKGVAGQSIGFSLMEGVTINLEGAANGGVGKSLSGGKIVVYPDRESVIHEHSHENGIIGNAALYGATSGALYAAGRAGSRFAIRNSGANAVIEGAGYAACNYMTAGSVVILGDVGDNFGSGMTGGEAFVYDENETLKKRTYDETTRKKIVSLEKSQDKNKLKSMVSDYFKATGSLRAKSMLDDWDNAVTKFKYIKGKVDKSHPAPAAMAA